MTLEETPPALRTELEALAHMGTSELKAKFQELDGSPPHSGNPQYLRKRCAWLLQAREFGGLSDAARKRAHKLARLSDLRLTAPEPDRIATQHVEVNGRRDPKLPPASTQLVRRYRGTEVRVTITDDGVEWSGVLYPSLSAAANAITGQHVSGPRFFGLSKRKRRS